MNNKEFDELLQSRIKKIVTTLKSKSKEYATEDKLYNFKVAARINNTTPAKALWGMATKHLVSVLDIINGKRLITNDMIDEKLGDMINYIILLEAIFKEKHGS